jgi:hypothetical protein
MTTKNLNSMQLEAMALIDSILVITDEMNGTPADVVTPGQAKDWMNQLSSLLCRLGTMEAEHESYFYRVMSTIRENTKSNADAELNAKATSEYFVYRKIKNFRQDLYEKIQSAKRLITEEPDGRKDGRQMERR